MPREPSNQIRDLQNKVQALAKALFDLPARDARRIENATIKALSEKAGIPYNSLKSRWSDSGKNFLSFSMQDKLCGLVPFSRGETSWNDTSFSNKNKEPLDCADTSVKFEVFIRKKLGLSRTQNFRLFPKAPSLADENLLRVSFEDGGQAIEEPTALSVFFSKVFGLGFDSGISFGFSKVRTRLHFKSGSEIRVLKPLGSDSIERLGNAALVCLGKGHACAFSLYQQTGVLKDEYATRRGPLVELEGYRDGDEFRAEVSVNMIDSDIKRDDGTELESAAKKSIIKILLAKKISGEKAGHRQGWISLGEQVLVVKAVS